MSFLPPACITALSRVETAILTNTYLAPSQLDSLLSDTSIRNITLDLVPLDNVDSLVLGRAVARMATASLCGTGLTGDQVWSDLSY